MLTPGFWWFKAPIVAKPDLLQWSLPPGFARVFPDLGRLSAGSCRVYTEWEEVLSSLRPICFCIQKTTFFPESPSVGRTLTLGLGWTASRPLVSPSPSGVSALARPPT